MRYLIVCGGKIDTNHNGKTENPLGSDRLHLFLPPVQILTGIPARISAVAGYAGHRL